MGIFGSGKFLCMTVIICGMQQSIRALYCSRESFFLLASWIAAPSVS